MSSMRVRVKGRSVDVYFLRFGCGRMRLMNQLRGKVTLCSKPRKRTLWAIMNNPESLSTKSHKWFRSMGSRLRKT